MSRTEQIIKEQFNQAWTQSVPFEDYERNRRMDEWLGDQRFDEQKILDIGCGDGVISEYFHKLGFDVHGVDLSEVGIAQARKRVPGAFQVVNTDESLPYEDSLFDAVFWGDNVEHLFDPESTLADIRRVLKPAGRLIISCPNVGLLKFRLIYLLRGSMPRHEGHVNQPWAWHHIRFFTPSILKAFLEDGGFGVVRRGAAARGALANTLSRWMPGAFGTVLLAEAISQKQSQCSKQSQPSKESQSQVLTAA